MSQRVDTCAKRNDRTRPEAERLESLLEGLSAAMAQCARSFREEWLSNICIALGLDQSPICERDASGRSKDTSEPTIGEK
jgi:hypothetical protein